jgi:Flp pilus assembly pilin Flp
MRALLAGFIGDRKASTGIEYGLIVGLCAFALLAGLQSLGSAINGQMLTIGTLGN